MSKSNKTELVNVGVPRNLHREMTEYVEPRGMKLRGLQAVMWCGLKLLSAEQMLVAQERAGQYLRRPRRRVPA